jgi:hypothetical protein
MGVHPASMMLVAGMNKFHVTSLPPNITSQDLCRVFERIGPVLHAKVIKDLHGNCIVGIVEMVHAEDVEEVLTTKDRVSIGGRRPIIWKVQAASIAQRIQEESTAFIWKNVKDGGMSFKSVTAVCNGVACSLNTKQ